MLRPSFRSVSAIAVLSVFPTFDCRPLPAQEVDDVIVGGSARPLDAFSHYIGAWAIPIVKA